MKQLQKAQTPPFEAKAHKEYEAKMIRRHPHTVEYQKFNNGGHSIGFSDMPFKQQKKRSMLWWTEGKTENLRRGKWLSKRANKSRMYF